LTSKEKDELLLRVMQGDLPQLGPELHQRFQRYWNRHNPIPQTSTATRRSAKELFAAFELLSEETRVQEERKAAEERSRREREKAEAHALFLASLSKRGENVWLDIEALIASKNIENYDEAVNQLKGVLELANRDGLTEPFMVRLKELKKRHATKSAFLKRLKKAGI
jgi:hypothetical protein